MVTPTGLLLVPPHLMRTADGTAKGRVPTNQPQGVALLFVAGVETLLEDTTAADPEWPKLLAVPGLLEPWNDAKDKWQVATDEFKVCYSPQAA